MRYEEHCKECLEKLGNEWGKVHKWLDAMASEYGLEYHRKVRHHKQGIEKVREMWGDEAAKAAELHIASDYGGSFIPDEYDYYMYGDFLMVRGYDANPSDNPEIQKRKWKGP